MWGAVTCFGEEGEEGQSDLSASALLSNPFSLNYPYAKVPYSGVAHPNPYHEKILKNHNSTERTHYLHFFKTANTVQHAECHVLLLSADVTPDQFYVAGVCIIIIYNGYILFHFLGHCSLALAFW